MSSSILILDSPSGLLTPHLSHLHEAGYEVVVARDEATATRLLAAGRSFATVVAVAAEGLDGIGFLVGCHAAAPHCSRVLVAGGLSPVELQEAINDARILRVVDLAQDAGALVNAIGAGLQEYIARTARRGDASSNQVRALLEHTAELARAQDLGDLARRAARAASESLPGRGVQVQLWDPGARDQGVEAGCGPEMSESMHREPLLGSLGEVGELVVDAPERTLPGAAREVVNWIVGPTAATASALIRRGFDAATQDAALLALARLADRKDDRSGRRVERVGRYAELLARSAQERGLYSGQIDDAFVADIRRAAPLHDLGKTVIPEALLLRPGRLNAAEWELMKTHPFVGAELLDELFPEGCRPSVVDMAKCIASAHHEHWDGAGYSQGLSGERIPLAARITSIAVVYDALTRPRPYRPARGHEYALSSIEVSAGSQFDPQLVQAFRAVSSEIEAIAVRLAEPGGFEDEQLAA